MSNGNLFDLKKPQPIVDDPVTELLRQGARRLLKAALEAEIEAFLEQYRDVTDNKGRRRLVRNGYLPEREIQTGIGQVPVKVPRIRDRQGKSPNDGIQFTSAILPKYLRRTKSIETLLPWLYLKGISTGDFADALAALVGKDAPGLSAGTISRLKSAWQDDYKKWQQRDLSHKRYVYFWADGIHCNVRMDAKQCLLVIIGTTDKGRKELVALEGGFRESEISWTEVLVDIKRRGLQIPPELAIGDGALGFWKALSKVFDTTAWQRCWVHKTANVLNKLPKSVQPKAKEKLHQIWMAEPDETSMPSFRRTRPNIQRRLSV